MDAMATAVEKASIVLICMSQKYKDSPNCRTGLPDFHCWKLKINVHNLFIYWVPRIQSIYVLSSKDCSLVILLKVRQKLFYSLNSYIGICCVINRYIERLKCLKKIFTPVNWIQFKNSDKFSTTMLYFICVRGGIHISFEKENHSNSASERLCSWRMAWTDGRQQTRSGLQPRHENGPKYEPTY